MATTPKGNYPRLLVLGLMSALLAFALGCDDGPPPLDEAKGAKKGPAKANPEARAALAKLTKKLSSKEAEKENIKLKLVEKDFVEANTNRDPFRSFMLMFNRANNSTVVIQRRVLLKRYSLEDLRLMAIISGNTRPIAMFVDPTKKGVTIKRGDYISKSEGRVKQILHDKVIIEIEEKTESGTSSTDRVVLLHDKESGRNTAPPLGSL
jgi:type IV pilus assembly protein PilP